MNKVAILTIFLFICLSCQTIRTKPPVYQEFTHSYIPPRSVIQIPAEIPLELISNQINRKFFGLLYQDDSFTRPTNDNLKLKVYMNKRIRISAKENELLFTIPLSIYATGRWSACVICPNIEGQTSFEMDVFLTSGIQIGPDYTFRMNTRADGFTWTRPPTVSVGPLKIPIARLLEDVLNEQLRQIAGEIDKNVNSNVDLRALVQPLWNMTAEPFLLDDSTETWLSVKPEQIFLGPIQGNDQRIRLNMGLMALIETTTGLRPPVHNPGPLPNITTIVPLDDKFHMQINASIGFDKTTLLAGRIKGAEFSQGKQKVKIEDIVVFGKGERAYIRLLLSGSIKGEVYLTGIPKFDGETEELYFDALDFDFNSRNVLIKSASWLLGGLVQKKLQQTLRFSFRTELAQIRESIRSQMKEYRYKNSFSLRGSLDRFTLRDILVQESNFVLIFDAEGNAGIYFNHFDF